MKSHTIKLMYFDKLEKSYILLFWLKIRESHKINILTFATWYWWLNAHKSFQEHFRIYHHIILFGYEANLITKSLRETKNNFSWKHFS